MPGERISDKQVGMYMKSRKSGYIQIVSAAKSGISERSGRNIEHGIRKVPKGSRKYRRTVDPLNGSFERDLKPLLEQSPALTPITLLEELQRRYEDKFPGFIIA